MDSDYLQKPVQCDWTCPKYRSPNTPFSLDCPCDYGNQTSWSQDTGIDMKKFYEARNSVSTIDMDKYREAQKTQVLDRELFKKAQNLCMKPFKND